MPDTQERVIQVGGTVSARPAVRTQVTWPQVMAGLLHQVEYLPVILSSQLEFGSGPYGPALSSVHSVRHSVSIPAPELGRGEEVPAG